MEISLPRVINAAGHLSMLGGGVSPAALAGAVAAAIQEAMTTPIEMERLKDEASLRIAAATGAEAACVTTGAAAGIALSVAACVAGEDLDRVRSLPGGLGDAKVVLQAGHDIDFGAPVVQMIRLGGGTPVLAGRNVAVTEAELAGALGGARAMVFVQSHHVHAPGRLSLDACIGVSRTAGVPVIVDAAAEEDLRLYITAGASLVIYSGGKALGGLSSSGLVAGRAPLIAAVRAQERGIGRAMKVGPEQLLSVCLALDSYGQGDHDDRAVLAMLSDGMRGCAGADFGIVDDDAGRPIQRLEVRTPRAAEVVRALRAGDPPIFVRAHRAAEGRFLVDPRNLSTGDAGIVVAALRRALGDG
jgi:uncharacterized pyridoxal phosphate-dependent enzyme